MTHSSSALTYHPASNYFVLEATPLPIGTAFHEENISALSEPELPEWSGDYTVSVYEVHHEHEYNAAALIDITSLYKYLITGKDATLLVNRDFRIDQGRSPYPL